MERPKKPVEAPDDELEALREEFISSLPVRLGQLRQAWTSGVSESALLQVTHKLAGVAGSYGFTELGKVAVVIDDLLGLPEAFRSRNQSTVAELLGELVPVVDRGLERAIATRKDPAEFLATSAIRRAICVAESLVSAASRGSF